MIYVVKLATNGNALASNIGAMSSTCNTDIYFLNRSRDRINVGLQFWTLPWDTFWQFLGRTFLRGFLTPCPYLPPSQDLTQPGNSAEDSRGVSSSLRAAPATTARNAEVNGTRPGTEGPRVAHQFYIHFLIQRVGI
jgi:hypothetical protein